MDANTPFAMLITWTCYGTWLPGDRRGYVSRTRHMDGTYEPKQNIPGSPITSDDLTTRLHAVAVQKYDTATLKRQYARVAAQAMIDACTQRGWHIMRAAIMWNHIHVVVSDCPDSGREVRRILKGIGPNALSKHVGKSRRWWTAGGSDRHLHGNRAIEAATNYVANQLGVFVEIADMAVVEPPSQRRDLSPPQRTASTNRTRR